MYVHRAAAYDKEGFYEVVAEVKPGSRDDAIDYACSGAPNSKHGLRETPEDRHRRIETMIRKHPDWNNAQIARWCGVSDETVRRISHNVEDRPTQRTVTRNGTTYTQDTTNIGKSEKPTSWTNPEPPPEVTEVTPL